MASRYTVYSAQHLLSVIGWLMLRVEYNVISLATGTGSVTVCTLCGAHPVYFYLVGCTVR